jgi:RNA polymerase sigma-70 factor (ECF subfamily)
MNRTYALSKARGKHVAVAEAEKLQLSDNYLYFVLLGDLYSDIDNAKAANYFNQSLTLIRNEPERKVVVKKLEALKSL